MRSRIAAFGGVLALVSLMAFVVVLRPQAAKVADTRQQTAAQEQRESELQLKLRQLQALEQKAGDLEDRARRADVAVPDGPELDQFVLQVQEAARKSAIDWLSVNPGAPTTMAQAGVQEIGVSMNLTGGYFQVQDFVTRLEALGRAVKISQVSLSPGPNGLPQLAATLVMKLFTSAPAA